MNMKIKKLLLVFFLIISVNVFAENDYKFKLVKAQGSGVTKEKALINAFKNAVRQAVGTFIDSETVVKNKQLIKDKVLMYSDGYVKTYKEIDSEEKSGVWTVTIGASVAITNLKKKITELGIGSVKVDNKGLFAEGITKIEKQIDGNAMFIKAFEGFPEKAFELSVSKPEIIGTASNGMVSIKYQIQMKLKAEFINNLEKVLKIIKVKQPKKNVRYFKFTIFEDFGVIGYGSRKTKRDIAYTNLKFSHYYKLSYSIYNLMSKNIPIYGRLLTDKDRHSTENLIIYGANSYKTDKEIANIYSKMKLGGHIIVEFITLDNNNFSYTPYPTKGVVTDFFRFTNSDLGYRKAIYRHYNVFYNVEQKISLEKLKKIKKIKVYIK